MKIVLFVILGVSLAGCAAVMPDSMRKAAGYGVTQYPTANITVTSEPAGARIYFNNTEIGMTPAYSLPVTIAVVNDASLLYQSFGADQYSVVGSYYVKVSKEGYEDAIAALEFNNNRTSGYGQLLTVKNDTLHFTLKKKE